MSEPIAMLVKLRKRYIPSTCQDLYIARFLIWHEGAFVLRIRNSMFVSRCQPSIEKQYPSVEHFVDTRLTMDAASRARAWLREARRQA